MTPADASELSIVAAGETDRGRRRKVNEDAILLRADLDLYMVADGAGGQAAGNVASALATTSVAKHFDDTESERETEPVVDSFGLHTDARRLSTAVQRANAAVIEVARSSNRYRGMGTTIACLLARPSIGRVHIAHVGDSRCYRLRAGYLDQMTDDHSMLRDVVELRPDLPSDMISKLPRKAVTRALGLESSLRVAVKTWSLAPGDRYLLSTDGLNVDVTDDQIATILGSDGTPAELVSELVESAKRAGGRDNVGVVVVECRPGPRRSSQRPPPMIRRPSAPGWPSVGPKSSTDRGAGSASPPPPTAIDASEIEITDPEILLVRGALASADLEEETNPRITAVPAPPDEAQFIQALGAMAEVITRAHVVCRNCRGEFERDGLYCPHCGASQSDLPPP